MAHDYEAVRRELEQKDVFKAWISSRVDEIHQRVSASDVLQRNGIRLRYGGHKPEQMFCPFHGNTKTPAARYHSANSTQNDHVWCFVCNKQWDSIELYKKFENFTGKFSTLLRLIERDYGITPPETPSAYEAAVEDTELIELESLLETCERRLKSSKAAFDMLGYLRIGSVLDKVSYGLSSGSIPYKVANATLQKVLGKIGEKIRSCPDC